MSKILCIYHANCMDGFAAAWVVRKHFGSDKVEFYAAAYNSKPPPVIARDVVIVDFSYPREVLLEMASIAQSILILDHHESAESALIGINDQAPNVHVIFDMQRSGARITWDFYNAKTPPPPLLRHIEDQDLWRFALANTKLVTFNVGSYVYDFEVWHELMKADVETLYADGEAIYRKHMKDIRELLPLTTHVMSIGNQLVRVANLPLTMKSEAGHTLDAHVPFAGTYYDGPDGRVFSLRSRKDTGANVARIAAKYGGGGHANAAGFKVTYTRVLLMAMKTWLHKLWSRFIMAEPPTKL
jgi:oligoribonuclease NrnB/cAMP/cGMP phosphodiesterase (DHH superfamily)